MRRTVFLVSSALAAGLAVTACGSGGSPAAAPSAAPAPSCLQQYRSWNAGPSHAAGEELVAALNELQAASATANIAITSGALRQAGTAAQTLARYPIPKCADPKGYWRAVLVQVQAAAHRAGTSNGQGTLAAAAGALKAMPALDRELAAELKHTLPGLNQK
jgi:hypothetical protein